MGMSVRDLLSRFDSKELAEWIAFDTIEPIGSVRTDLAAGIVASTVANCHRGKNQSAFSPMDFMPLQKPVEEQTPEEIGQKLLAFSIMNKSVQKVEE